MWLEAGLTRQAAEFWELAGRQGGLALDIVGAAMLALPLSVHLLPDLTVSSAQTRLRRYDISLQLSNKDRRLRGCLIAYRGHGFVLLDGEDSPDEQRFTAAHEIAHFLVDYREPRIRAIEALGEEILPVLDGERNPSQQERLHAILSAVPLGLHVELFDRAEGRAGEYTSKATLDAEVRADRLAIELLAPAEDVWAALLSLPGAEDLRYQALRSRATMLLKEQFGLPDGEARGYASWLLKKAGIKPGFSEWMG